LFHNADFIRINRVNVPLLLAGLVVGEALAVDTEPATMPDNARVYKTFEHYIPQRGVKYVSELQLMLSGFFTVPYICFIVFIYYICFFQTSLWLM
jgi:hypothetical protein